MENGVCFVFFLKFFFFFFFVLNQIDYLLVDSALRIIIIFLLTSSSLQIPEGGTGDSGRERTKTFTYDFSFYSADTKSPDYVSQEMVWNFQDLSCGLFSY